MYNVVNPDEIKNGSKPILEEIGPFVYRETREKKNISMSSDECSVTAAQYKSYEFDQAKTDELCPDCGDARNRTLTMINAAYVGILQFIREGFSKFFTVMGGIGLLKSTFTLFSSVIIHLHILL